MPSVVEVNKETPCFYVKAPNSAKRGKHSKKEEFIVPFASVTNLDGDGGAERRTG
jgi:hypothetical protein